MKFYGVATDDFLAWYASLPKDAHGNVVDPMLLPKHKQAAAVDAWREWCRKHPRQKDWPDFIHALIARKKVAPLSIPPKQGDLYAET